jgi:hypothetical protein
MRLWPSLVGAWLVLHGLSSLINLSFRYDNIVMGSLALVAGFFVIIRR